MANENPLEYAAKKYDLDSCSCFTDQGDILMFNQTSARVIKNRINPFPVDPYKFNEEEI